MDKTRIQGIFEKNLLEEKVVTADNSVQVYMRNVRLNIKDPFTYKCNICQNDIEGQQALFEHNKLAEHIDKVKALSANDVIVKKITELKSINTCNLDVFSDSVFDSASLSTVEKAIQTLDKVYHYYEKCPENHPSYKNDWAEFYQRRKTELLAEFRDVSSYDFSDEWKTYWGKRQKEYYRKSVSESIDYIIENYTMNNTALSCSTTVLSLESGELPDSPKRKKRHRRRPKSHKRRSKSHGRRRVLFSPRHSVTPSDRSSSIDRRRRSRKSKSPVARRHRLGGRSRSRTRKRSSPGRSPKRNSSASERRRRRSISRPNSIFARRNRRHSDRSSSNDRHRLSRSRSMSPHGGRLRLTRGRSGNRNGARTSNDLRYSIQKRRYQRERSPEISPVVHSDRSTSTEPRSVQSNQPRSSISKRHMPRDQSVARINRICSTGHFDQSDSGQFSSDAQTSGGKWKPLPFSEADDRKTVETIISMTQSSFKGKSADVHAEKPLSNPVKLVNEKSVPSSPIPSKAVPLKPAPLNPVPSQTKVVPLKHVTSNSVPSQSTANQPIMKSILKKSSPPTENSFARAKRLLSSSNSNMQQFYDKVKLKTVVEASKRVLKFLSSNKSGPYPTDMTLDKTLLSSQVRSMLECMSIDPSSLTNDQVEILMTKYMHKMSSDNDIVTKSAPVSVNGNSDGQFPKPSSSIGKENVVMNGTVIAPINAAERCTREKISTAIPIQPSKIDRLTLLNDIDFPKCIVQPSTSTGALRPNPRDPRLRANKSIEQTSDCLDVVDMDIEQKTDSEVASTDVEYTGSETELESDDDCQYVGTFAYEGY